MKLANNDSLTSKKSNISVLHKKFNSFFPDKYDLIKQNYCYIDTEFYLIFLFS